jgi:hypothetical protein
MKAIFAYNFRSKTMDVKPTAEKPKFGGPTSAFSPYKVSDTSHQFPEIRHRRKSAFRKLKIMFGISEPVCVDSADTSSDSTDTSQK